MKRRICALFLAVVLCFSVLQINAFAVYPSPYTFNDVNGDGVITLIDGLVVFQIAMGLKTVSPEVMVKADTNKDGKVTIIDAYLYLKAMIA